ncbi:MAG TPA: hypothetical protein VFK13_08670 [Gemmatimonadaceae bacterium]|nr:hypothetical protein [Gemmatimonadaceae bacterium]
MPLPLIAHRVVTVMVIFACALACLGLAAFYFARAALHPVNEEAADRLHQIQISSYRSGTVLGTVRGIPDPDDLTPEGQRFRRTGLRWLVPTGMLLVLLFLVVTAPL